MGQIVLPALEFTSQVCNIDISVSEKDVQHYNGRDYQNVCRNDPLDRVENTCTDTRIELKVNTFRLMSQRFFLDTKTL